MIRQLVRGRVSGEPQAGRPTVPCVTEDLATLEEARDERAVRRARNYRRAGLTALALVVLAGLTGILGIRSATVTSRSDGYVLSVTHAQTTRAGIAVPFHIRVVHRGGFDRPVQVAVSAQLLERFDFQNFYPNPSKETSSGRYVHYEFDPPPGDILEVSLDARTSPDQNGSIDRYNVLLTDGAAIRTSVSFRMIVAP